MTADKKEPENKPAGSASAQGPRPHATLDLKAKDLTPPAPAKPATADASAKDKPSTTATSAASAASSASSTPASTTKPDAAKTDKDTKSDKPAKDAKPTVGAPPPGAAQPPAARGHGGFFTHVAAGLVGGLIALLAADALVSQFGISLTSEPDKTAALEQRLTAIEASRSQRSASTELAARLAAAEAKLSKVEQLDTNIGGISQKQADFDKTLNSLNEKLSTQGEGSPEAERITKLEEQLATMAKAAESDPQSGRIPQLAAITGKLADLEQTMSIQLDALRKGVAEQLATGIGTATEAGEAARAGAQRLDREVSTLKAEATENSTGLNSLKTDVDQTSAALQTVQEDLKRLKADVYARLAAFARPEDVSTAVTPLSDKLAALQQDVQTVLKSEGDRRSTAERIVLSLELANLKRAIDRGKPYATELEQTRKVAGGVVDLAPLDRFALDGVPTTTELRQQFKPIAFTIIDAEEQQQDGSIVDRLLAGAKSVVRVRKTAPNAEDKSTEATVARIETALNEDRLTDVLELAKTLPAPAREAAAEFLRKVEAREAVDHALSSVESQLKASLAAAPAPDSGKAAQ
ncbi:hypothetical protein [Hyphomicrobium sp. NDB2Meth4]|uniref:hypothetical protein n=1 Tax=Hyphomicrobium sp. NDB2Meth4 TaxID=1892846 RepID=UPI0009303CBE|nr:hypothetical protein [Hyphomicrobium sp. NDB2Meth4]